MGLTALVFAAVVAPIVALVGLAAWLDREGRRSLPDRRWDVVVVAGCRVMPDGRPSAALARRVALAVDLFHDGRAPRVVLTGGVGAGAPTSEARCAARLCVERGVPAEALVLEERSTSTLENAAFARELLGHGDHEVLVVTDAPHAFRCRRMFGRHFRSAHAVGAAPAGWPRARMAMREAGAVLRHGVSGRL